MRPLFQLPGKILLSLILVATSANLFAQVRCGTTEYNKLLHLQNNVLESEAQFESWLHEHIEKRRAGNQRVQATYNIPVVVHIVHNGEAVGTGVNIPDAQVISQIKVLNNDFKRLNADASNTPSTFQSVAGSLDIQFVLAKRTPTGGPTNGIVRVQGSKTVWEFNDNYELKAQSYWPAEDYLNIWVTNIAGPYLGYTQFPVSGLPGLENSSNNRLTDGVVVDYSVFGSSDDGAFDLENSYDKGRTTTHEVGHFFGLRHIWGDQNDCSGTDYVNDTPAQPGSTNGCPSHPQNTSCSTVKMFQNYMDYTDDACMNLYTKDQVNRMISVIENSTRRKTLLTSPGDEDPTPAPNDMGIASILFPGSATCSDEVTPGIDVINTGSNTVTSIEVRLVYDGSPIETMTVPVNLAQQESASVYFSPVTITAGNHTFAFFILQTNGGTDGNTGNNSASITTTPQSTITAPFAEAFNSTPSSWIISNPDGKKTWTNVTATSTSTTNRAMYMNFYDYENSQGENDLLITPAFDLSSVPSAYASFDLAYAIFPGSQDALRVYVLTDCGTNIYAGTLKYDKTGSGLSTAPSTAGSFSPTSSSQWRKEIIDLTEFIGNSSVQLAFVGISDWGNNLYLDNIAVITTADEDLRLREIVTPSPVSCNDVITPQLRIGNIGGVTITSFKVQSKLNNGTAQTTDITTTLQQGDETVVSLPSMTLQEGANTLSFNITTPNGLVDASPADNAATITVAVNKATGRIPLRENFNDDFSANWTIVNPNGGTPWSAINTNYDQSVYFNAFDDASTGDESWLVSPAFDLSKTNTASLLFNLSYTSRASSGDQLRILASTDCGNTYNTVLYNASGSELGETTSSAAWKPATAADWQRKYVSLNELTGSQNVRLAFVFINANGNNLFLDNIRISSSEFLVYNTSPSEPGDFYLAFNLDTTQPVGYEIINDMGITMTSEVIRDVLDQTFLINAGDTISSGIYIVRLHIGNKYYATRVYLSRG